MSDNGSARNIINIINYAIRQLDLFTNSATHDKVIDRFEKNESENETINYVVTSGIPPDEQECSVCGGIFPSYYFGYYQTRINSEGYLMRSNALCVYCRQASAKERESVFQRSEIPPAPASGSVCKRCDRTWTGNWHRHHTEEQGFVAWWCSNCNMAWQNNRNPRNFKSTDL